MRFLHDRDIIAPKYSYDNQEAIYQCPIREAGMLEQFQELSGRPPSPSDNHQKSKLLNSPKRY